MSGSFHAFVMLRSEAPKHLVGGSRLLRIRFTGMSSPAPPDPSPPAQGDTEKALSIIWEQIAGTREPMEQMSSEVESLVVTRVKICGIQQDADALMAAEAGADFIGLVFVPNRRRRIDEDRARSIVSALRETVGNPPKVVGLFADQPLDEVNRLVQRCDLDIVQLCGEESLEYCGEVCVPVIKVLHVVNSLPVEDAVDLLSEKMESLKRQGYLVTLDRKVEGLQGGTGQSFDWDIARRLSDMGFSFLLAGGLTPENVGLAVEKVRPWGVDVSSGVETDGVKDKEKIRRFVQEARSVKTK